MGLSGILLLLSAALFCLQVSAQKKTSCDCGWENKITGNKTNQFPWLAAIWSKVTKKPVCGATIVTKLHAITSGHCAYFRLSSIGMVVGDIDPGKYNYKESGGNLIDIWKFVVHPYYNYDEDPRHDIALIVTKTDIPFSLNVGPVCLPAAPTEQKGQVVTAMGWVLNADKTFSVNQVNLNILSLENCGIYDWIVNPEIEFCGKENNKGVCLKDTLGTGVWLDPEIERRILVGIPKYFSRSCRFPRPVGFVNVIYYIPWIKRKIEENQGGQICSKE